MSERIYLYSLGREGFDLFARTYYQAPRPRLAKSAATDVLDVGEPPLGLTWPLSPHRLPGVTEPLTWKVRAAYSSAWEDRLRQAVSAGLLDQAVSGGLPVDHVPRLRGTGATFHAPHYVARIARSLSRASVPKPGPVRAALRQLLAEVEAERRGRMRANADGDAFITHLGEAGRAISRLDVIGAVDNVGAALAWLAGAAIREWTPPWIFPASDVDIWGYTEPSALARLDRAVDFISGNLAALDEWEASHAEERLDALRLFYCRASDAHNYIVMEPS